MIPRTPLVLGSTRQCDNPGKYLRVFHDYVAASVHHPTQHQDNMQYATINHIPPPSPIRIQDSETLNNSLNLEGSILQMLMVSSTSSLALPIYPSAPLSQTSEELYFLIYRYLQECGFVHSALRRGTSAAHPPHSHGKLNTMATMNGNTPPLLSTTSRSSPENISTSACNIAKSKSCVATKFLPSNI